MTVLLTGGCGYIGTHMAWALHHAGERVVILDDLSNGRADAVPPGMPLVCADIGAAETTRRVLREHGVREVIHLAGRRRIAESVADPLDCYRTNVAAMSTLLQEAVRAGVGRVIFASSAAVYGVPATGLVDEEAPTSPLNPYGWSKLMGERMLADAAAAHGLRYAVLRYFNVAGADLLVRAAAEAALGRREALEIYGTDWPTRDGSCVRDFIHVSDLVDIHLEALRHLRAGGPDLVLNCASGHGTSVLEVVAAFERATGRPLPVRRMGRRPGDTAEVVADTGRLARILGWRPRFAAIDIIVEQALRGASARPGAEGGADAASDATFEAFVTANLDRDAYLDAYPDVAAAGMDPVDHWLDHGLAEGRLAPGLVVQRGTAARDAAGEGWVLFNWRGDRIAARSRPRPQDQAVEAKVPQSNDDAFARFVAANLDREAYSCGYPDVAAAGLDPVQHWLTHGLQEGRTLAPGARIKRGDEASRTQGPGWQHFIWHGEPIAIHLRLPPEEDPILRQIRDQARHEPAIFAIGKDVMLNLRRLERRSRQATVGAKLRAILDGIERPPETVLLVPWLGVGGGEKYGADLLQSLKEAGGGRTLVMVTDQTPLAAADWEKLAILAPYRQAEVVFLRELASAHGKAATLLAALLNALRPRRIIVINSGMGLDAVAHFGRGLSRFAHLCCAYFSMGIPGVTHAFGELYPRRTGGFALTLTDNEEMASCLRGRYGDLPGQGIALLPGRVEVASEGTLEPRLAARHARLQGARRPRSWLWVSRVERWKGTQILGALADRRPGDRFDVFGPVTGSLAGLGLQRPNIVYCGVLTDVLAADFSRYDAFVFTSHFEGMPSVVLEMSQHAIPLVLADVGGIRDTFSQASALLVRHKASAAETAAAFDEALNNLERMTTPDVMDLVTEAYRCVAARHAPEMHRRAVGALFGLQ